MSVDCTQECAAIYIRVISSISGLLLIAVTPGGESHLTAVWGQVRHHVSVRLPPLFAEIKILIIYKLNLSERRPFNIRGNTNYSHGISSKTETYGLAL